MNPIVLQQISPVLALARRSAAFIIATDECGPRWCGPAPSRPYRPIQRHLYPQRLRPDRRIANVVGMMPAGIALAVTTVGLAFVAIATKICRRPPVSYDPCYRRVQQRHICRRSRPCVQPIAPVCARPPPSAAWWRIVVALFACNLPIGNGDALCGH